MKPTLVGIHPRPEWLVKLTRDYDRGRASKEELDEGFDRAEEELKELQSKWNFDPKVDGLFRWQDMFRPLTEAIDGVKAGPLTRFFDNNTFYRRPVVKGLKYVGGVPFKGEKLILPGPYTFYVLSEVEMGKSSFYQGLLSVYKDLVDDLRPKAVQLNEPALAYRYRKWEPSEEDYDWVATFARELDASVHLYFGDPSEAYVFLAEREVPEIGLDLVEGPVLEDLGVPLTLGVVDGRNTYMEDLNYLVRVVTSFQEVRYVAPNCDLEFLPYEYAKRKMVLLHALVEVLS